MKQISFLIGSGFSIPAGLPTTGEINQRLQKVKESEICIHTSQDAWFLKEGETNPNADWMNVEKRKFVEEFINFYNKSVLSDKDKFHYEDFFDYYSYYLNDNHYPDNLSSFLENFLIKHKLNDGHDLLFNFDLTFNQLISGLIQKKFERVSLGRSYNPNYNAFLSLLDILDDYNVVHLHSLNHDLYMEYLSQSETLSQNFDDGFQEIGSPFYGDLYNNNERYMVRLPRFVNKYEKKFRYYKLHGSINNYWYNEKEESTLIRLKWGLGKTDVFKEVKEKGVLKYDNYPLYFHSDFLSGTTAKIKRYDKGHYYPMMFNYFSENIRNSDYLIIIGYGFGDKKINELIENNFNLGGKRIFIVDIKKPSIPLIESDSAIFIDGGIVNMDINKILSNLDKGQKLYNKSINRTLFRDDDFKF